MKGHGFWFGNEFSLQFTVVDLLNTDILISAIGYDECTDIIFQ